MDWEKLLSAERIRKSTPYDLRNEFESDYGRIIYSPALRRMHDKTQVFPLTTDDNIHSRLTHSTEVMSIGYTFGIRLSNSPIFLKKVNKEEIDVLRIFPILLQNICLIHDIGNSPFGHFGETIISNYFKNLFDKEKVIFDELNPHQKRDFINYDGNAQGLRVLTKLQILNDPFGLNLSYATLSSSIKYPNYEEWGENEQNFIENKKHGIFYSEKEYFELIAEKTDLNLYGRVIRHPLCYLMEAADSIAYLCMDMEDGFNKGIYSILHVIDKFKEKQDIKLCKEIYDLLVDKDQNNTYKIVNVRIKLIAYFVNLAFNNFINNLDKIEIGEYNQELIEDDSDNIYKIVKSFSTEIFKSREINNLESTGYSVIVGLLNFYIDFIFLKDDPKFIGRATALISNSIIDAAIEETLIDTCQRKIESDASKIKENIESYNNKEDDEFNKLEEELRAAKIKEEKFKEFAKSFSELLKKQKKEVISTKSEEYRRLSKLKADIYKLIEPSFNDLDTYYKLRVIVDFISGMTDQYALKHYQKISGQRIS